MLSVSVGHVNLSADGDASLIRDPGEEVKMGDSCEDTWVSNFTPEANTERCDSNDRVRTVSLLVQQWAARVSGAAGLSVASRSANVAGLDDSQVPPVARSAGKDLLGHVSQFRADRVDVVIVLSPSDDSSIGSHEQLSSHFSGWETDWLDVVVELDGLGQVEEGQVVLEEIWVPGWMNLGVGEVNGPGDLSALGRVAHVVGTKDDVPCACTGNVDAVSSSEDVVGGNEGTSTEGCSISQRDFQTNLMRILVGLGYFTSNNLLTEVRWESQTGSHTQQS